jgi:hypothetical protein
MSQLILDGASTYDCASIEADRYFDAPGYIDRQEIEQKCVDMAGNYYGKVEKAEVAAPAPASGAPKSESKAVAQSAS